MHAMVLNQVGAPLEWTELPDRQPGPGEIRVRVGACGVCRTDLHVVDSELPHPQLPIIPGHEIVGRIDAVGAGVRGLQLGERVGIPWLGHTCGVCPYCAMQREDLCDRPIFTGYTRDGGFATGTIADARFALPLGEVIDKSSSDESMAPLLCAGLIGWRALTIAGDGKRLGLYGFGAAAHLLAQVAVWQGRSVSAFTRPGDLATQAFARSLGACWAGGSDEMPPQPSRASAGPPWATKRPTMWPSADRAPARRVAPVHRGRVQHFDTAIIFAPVGALVPVALKAVRKGGRVVCAGIPMSDIPGFPYASLWEERQLLSVANPTRQDGLDFLGLAPKIGIVTKTTAYPLQQANQALADWRAGRFDGAAVLIP